MHTDTIGYVFFESAKRIICVFYRAWPQETIIIVIISCDIQYWPCQERLNISTTTTIQGTLNTSNTVSIDLTTYTTYNLWLHY